MKIHLKSHFGILNFRLKLGLFYLFFFLFSIFTIQSQQVAILKYKGGGDWYANPTALPNLIEFCNKNIKTSIKENPETVEVNSVAIFNYPIVFMTGHGNVSFSDNDIENLKNYLISGGFLHISDNYGLDKYVRTEMKKVFPTLDFQEIPYNDPIYHQTFSFENGCPKIHEHNNKQAQGLGYFMKEDWFVFTIMNRI